MNNRQILLAITILTLIIGFTIISFSITLADIESFGTSTVAERILGIKTFVNGIVIKDPNTATIDPNGLAKFKTCQVNGANVATLDANSKVPLANSYSQSPDNLDANSIGLGVAKDTNYAIKVGASKFTVDPNGSITAAADTNTTFTFGRGKMGYCGSGGNDFLAIGHYDNFISTTYAFGQHSSGNTFINSPGIIYFNNSGNNIATISSTGLTMTPGKIISSCNIEPITDDTYYLGENDDDTPHAYKGVIMKDTTNGKYYRIEITNGTITATDLTD